MAEGRNGGGGSLAATFEGDKRARRSLDLDYSDSLMARISHHAPALAVGVVVSAGLGTAPPAAASAVGPISVPRA